MKCINNPNLLKMSFEVNFTGLTGEKSSIDAGALSFGFLGALLKDASLRLLVKHSAKKKWREF